MAAMPALELTLAIATSSDDNSREMSGIFFDDPGVRF
jgi:hypothetical protein